MANKLPWFCHDHNARNDDFIRRAEDKFGHFGYSGYFKMLELLHEHGTGDELHMTRSRFAAELRSRWPQVRLLLDFCRTSGKVQTQLSSSEVRLQIKKFREKQSRLKSNLPSTFAEPPLHRDRYRDRHNTPISPKGDDRDGFDIFWKAYPKKVGKEAARRSWKRINPSPTLQDQIVAAVKAQCSCDQWTRDAGQFIPHPTTWINQGRWQDEIEVVTRPEPKPIQPWTCNSCGKGKPEAEPDPEAWDGDLCKKCSKDFA